MAGESTLLVDCDLRRHNASRIVLGENEGRLLDVLNGTMSIEDALVKDSLTNLMVLGSTVELEGGANPLSSQAVRDLFDRLRPMFDFIILDTSPILGVADARVVAAEADACVLLARWRKTAVRTVDVALEMLIAANVPVSGIALTQVNVAKFGSNRDDIYGYRNEFKGYYRD